jgi:hypothetical protein
MVTRILDEPQLLSHGLSQGSAQFPELQGTSRELGPLSQGERLQKSLGFFFPSQVSIYRCGKMPGERTGRKYMKC